MVVVDAAAQTIGGQAIGDGQTRDGRRIGRRNAEDAVGAVAVDDDVGRPGAKDREGRGDEKFA